MHIAIRLLTEADAHTSVVWRNIPEIWAYTGSAPTKHITIEDELNWIRRVMANPDERRFAIMADGTYVGNTYLTGITVTEAEFHIFIGDQNYWGKGIARKATRLVLEYAKETLKLTKINLEVRRENAAAFHLYESLGFKEQHEEDGTVTMRLDLAEFV